MNIEQIIKSYPPLTHAEDLQQICKPLEALGINYFAHVHVNKQNQFSAIGLNPEYIKLYAEKSYYNYDIHMAAQHSREAYIIWDFLDLGRQTKELSEDTKRCGINHLFTLIQPSDHGKEYFHFATSAGNQSANNNYLQNLVRLKKFILYFKEKVHEHKKLPDSYNFKFSIAAEKANFHTSTPLLATGDEAPDQSVALSCIYIDDIGTYLTKREFESLYWMSLGKTMDEIATILAISPRTVKAHITHIKEKTGCYNQFQLGSFYEKFSDVLK